MTFNELKLFNNIQQALEEEGYTNPTPIQEQAIPEILAGQDLVACAQTGTGKTGAFAIPILNLIHRIVGSAKKAKHIKTLVVTPTRELAIQIDESFKKTVIGERLSEAQCPDHMPMRGITRC